MSLSLISIPIFTHLLTTSEYGSFALYTVWISMLTPFMGLGLHMSVGRAKIEFKDSYYSYVSSIICFIFILFVISCLPLYLFKTELLELTDIPENLYILLIIQVLMSLIISVGIGLLQFEFKYKTVSSINFIQAFFSILFSVLLIFYCFNDMKLQGRVLGPFIIDFLLTVCVAFYILHKGKVFVNIEYWVFGLKYSIPFIFGSLSYVINSQFDRLLINEYIGSSDAGIYSFAYSIGMLLLLIAIAVKQALNPWVYEKLDNEQSKPVKKVYVYYIAVFSIITIFLMYMSPELVKILSDKEYWGGIEILPWIIVAAYIQVLILNESETQMFLKKTAINSFVIILGAALNIALNYKYIPEYGAVGAAITTLVTYVVMFIIIYLLNLRYFTYSLVNLKVYLLSISYVLFFTVLFLVFREDVIFRLMVLLVNFFTLFKIFFYIKMKEIK